MTRTISLADDAYEALRAAKRGGESFSDVARRLARRSRLEDLFDPDLRIDMDAAEARRRVQAIHAARDETTGPRS